MVIVGVSVIVDVSVGVSVSVGVRVTVDVNVVVGVAVIVGVDVLVYTAVGKPPAPSSLETRKVSMIPSRLAVRCNCGHHWLNMGTIRG
jgi:hypothetical protein